MNILFIKNALLPLRQSYTIFDMQYVVRVKFTYSSYSLHGSFNVSENFFIRKVKHNKFLLFDNNLIPFDYAK